MILIRKIHETINALAQDPQLNITKIDDYTFDIIIEGDLMPAFDNLGDIQKLDDICSDEYALKTVYGMGKTQDLF